MLSFTAAPALALKCSSTPGRFDQWLGDFKTVAAKQGLSKKTLNNLDGLTYATPVIKADRNQKHFKQSFAQFSARPWRLDPKVALDEMRSYAASPVFDELLDTLAHGQTQEGAPRGSIRHPLVIGWGWQDRVCFPRQAQRALEAFPDARLQWFDHCGHFPHWDAPEATTELILRGTVTTAEARTVPLRDPLPHGA